MVTDEKVDCYYRIALWLPPTVEVPVTPEQAKRNVEIEASPWEEATHYEYKGHQYIQFHTSSGKYSRAAAVHDPDCPCGDR